MIGKRLEAFVALAFVASGLVALCGGCGSGGTSMNTPVTAAQVSAVTLTITDAPPAGVTVLSFEVTVNGAVLSPGNVQLIASPDGMFSDQDRVTITAGRAVNPARPDEVVASTRAAALLHERGFTPMEIARERR